MTHPTHPTLHEVPVETILVPMTPVTRAIDQYLGDLARRGYSVRTLRTYERILEKFADTLPDDTDVTELGPDDFRKFLNHYKAKARGTQAHAFAVLSSFCKWLYMNEKVKRNPIDRLERPRRIPAENLDVTTVSADDVRALLEHANGWTERLAVAIPAYTGARRRAVAQLRLKDYDRKGGRLRFHEKGGKVIWKKVPTRLAELLEAAITDGVIPDRESYLVPTEGYLWDRDGKRDDRVIWKAVKKAAARAGVDAHVHSLRGAFAVLYLEANPGDIEGLRSLLGHSNLNTTQTYLRRLNREQGMERVRELTWDEPADAPLRITSGSPDIAVEEPASWVYFIANDAGAVKIGVTGDPLRRHRTLQHSHAGDLTLLLAVPGDSKLEAELHRKHADDRLRGEWFTLSTDVLDTLATFGNRRDAIGVQAA